MVIDRRNSCPASPTARSPSFSRVNLSSFATCSSTSFTGSKSPICAGLNSFHQLPSPAPRQCPYPPFFSVIETSKFQKMIGQQRRCMILIRCTRNGAMARKMHGARALPLRRLVATHCQTQRSSPRHQTQGAAALTAAPSFPVPHPHPPHPIPPTYPPAGPAGAYLISLEVGE
jgi:hypothetical protein